VLDHLQVEVMCALIGIVPSRQFSDGRTLISDSGAGHCVVVYVVTH
jgi:hypothetical protein